MTETIKAILKLMANQIDPKMKDYIDSHRETYSDILMSPIKIRKFCKKIFDEMDTDNSGLIEFSELETFMNLVTEPLGMNKHTPKDV